MYAFNLTFVHINRINTFFLAQTGLCEKNHHCLNLPLALRKADVRPVTGVAPCRLRSFPVAWGNPRGRPEHCCWLGVLRNGNRSIYVRDLLPTCLAKTLRFNSHGSGGVDGEGKVSCLHKAWMLWSGLDTRHSFWHQMQFWRLDSFWVPELTS